MKKKRQAIKTSLAPAHPRLIRLLENICFFDYSKNTLETRVIPILVDHVISYFGWFIPKMWPNLCGHGESKTLRSKQLPKVNVCSWEGKFTFCTGWLKPCSFNKTPFMNSFHTFAYGLKRIMKIRQVWDIYCCIQMCIFFLQKAIYII